MSTERIPHDTPANVYPTAQPEAASRFEAPKAMPAEKKHRKRKKNRRRNQGESIEQLPSKQSTFGEVPASNNDEQAKPLSLDSDTVMLWHRPETDQSADSDSRRHSSPLGEKAFAAATAEDAKPAIPAETTLAQQATTADEQPAHYEPYRPYAPAEKAQVSESERQPEPPALPPDPLSYRRRFWNEQSPSAPDARVAEHQDLPPIHDYEEMTFRSGYTEAPASEPSRREGPAAVPLYSRHESDTPPGLTSWWAGRRAKRQEAGSHAVPQLEAEPIHAYPTSESETSRAPIRVEPLSVETHQPAVRAASAVDAFERITRQPIAEQRDKLPRAAKVAASKAAEAVIGRPQTLETRPLPGSERQLGKQELLKVAKDIKIDGIRLKDIYKANRLDEEGLRAIVDVYLRGGDVKQQLSQEIITKEQSYERDPQLRHQRRSAEHDNSPRSSVAAEKIAKVLGQAREIVLEQGGKLAASSQKTAKKASRVVANGAKQAQHDIIDNSNTRDWLGITAVVVVYSIILLLWLA